MKKMLAYFIICFVVLALPMFAQETDYSYWQKEVDVNGRLVTYYFCKTDAQFNNNFEDIVKKQANIKYYSDEPNWYALSSGLSEEAIKKNYPNLYKTRFNLSGAPIYWGEFNYVFGVLTIKGTTIVVVNKRFNDKVYYAANLYNMGIWYYTSETYDIFESWLKD